MLAVPVVIAVSVVVVFAVSIVFAITGVLIVAVAAMATIPMMIMFHAAAVSSPVAGEELASVVARRDPIRALVGRTSVIAFMPTVMPAYRIPVARDP